MLSACCAEELGLGGGTRSIPRIVVGGRSEGRGEEEGSGVQDRVVKMLMFVFRGGRQLQMCFPGFLVGGGEKCRRNEGAD